jgi:hypothetical protein
MNMRSEKETREQLIDPKLSQAHWELAEENGVIEAGKACVEIPVHGMPATSQSPSGDGFIDYVLFGKDAKPLADHRSEEILLRSRERPCSSFHLRRRARKEIRRSPSHLPCQWIRSRCHRWDVPAAPRFRLSHA